jgi:hypothetical protein
MEDGIGDYFVETFGPFFASLIGWNVVNKTIFQSVAEKEFREQFNICKNRISDEEIKQLYIKLKENKFIINRGFTIISFGHDIRNPNESAKPKFEKYIHNYTFGKDNKKLDEEHIKALMNWWYWAGPTMDDRFLARANIVNDKQYSIKTPSKTPHNPASHIKTPIKTPHNPASHIKTPTGGKPKSNKRITQKTKR